MSYKVHVLADDSGKYATNGLVFESEDDAKCWASDLMMRWTAVRDWKIEPSEEPPNRRFEGGNLVILNPPAHPA